MKLIYSKIEDISDESLATFFKSLKDNITKGEILNINSALLAFLPGLFLPVPFFSAVKHLSFNKKLLSELQCKFDLSEPIKTKKILWFTDTLTELNGVSMSLRQIGRLASEKGANITFAASITEDEMKNEHGYEILNIPCIESFKIPFYESYTLRIPSILKALEMICSYSPDEIYISTPGPMGLLGMLAAKLLTVKTEAIYHTDFSREADKIFKGESEFTLSLLETYMKWFYDSADEISVPTKVYLNILKDRGYNLSKMKLFKKGLNLKTFFPQPYNKSRNYLKENFGVGNGINLLYAGRISKDKDINFLFEVYKKLQKTFPDLNLLLAGDGPDFEEFKQETDIFNRNTLQQTTEHPGSSKNGLHAGKNKVTLLGTIDQNELRHIYSGSDIFVFPSTTDTFGMAVLEAQACGLPAVVSDIGGPMEIVINGKSGFVLPALDLDAWYLKITEIIKSDTADYNSMRKNAEQNAADNYDLEKTFYSLFPKISIEVA